MRDPHALRNRLGLCISRKQTLPSIFILMAVTHLGGPVVFVPRHNLYTLYKHLLTCIFGSTLKQVAFNIKGWQTCKMVRMWSDLAGEQLSRRGASFGTCRSPVREWAVAHQDSAAISESRETEQRVFLKHYKALRLCHCICTDVILNVTFRRWEPVAHISHLSFTFEGGRCLENILRVLFPVLECSWEVLGLQPLWSYFLLREVHLTLGFTNKLLCPSCPNGTYSSTQEIPPKSRERGYCQHADW